MIRNLNLRERWEGTWRKLHVGSIPEDVFDALIHAYSGSDRFYHNLKHIEDCLSIFELAKSQAVHSEEVELAIWFHDAVYNTRRSDNEERSAAWAGSVVRQSGLDNEIAERVSRSILATRHAADVTDPDARILVDVDLSILGREADVFWRYEENIRKEYAWVSESLFRTKRLEILRGFLERQHIYYCKKYRDLFEEKARMNLRQAIDRLSDMTSTAG